MAVRLSFVCLLFALLAAGAACDRNPETLKLRYVRAGDAYVAKKQYAQAIIEYRRAVQVAPTYGEARFKLAEAYAASDETLNALGEYVRAADLLPDNHELQIKAGNLLLMFGRFQDAKTRARTVLKRDPKNPVALVLLGNALAGLRSLDDAIEVAERVTALLPSRAGTYTNLGALRLAKGDHELAETAFKKAVSVGGKAIPPYLALGNFYRAAGRVDEAERTLRQALSFAPTNAQVNRALGTLLMEASRQAEAEPYFRAAAAASTDISSQLALADYLASVGKTQDAIALLTKLAADKQTFATAKTRIAAIQVSGAHRADAYRTIDEVLAKAPKDSNILAFKAQLLLADHRTDEAFTLIKAAVIADPRSAQVQLMRGRILVAKGQLEEARKAFAEALDIDPRGIDAALELSQLHMRRQELETSITFAERAVKTHPDNLSAHLMLVQALTSRSEDYARAETEVRALLVRYPAQAAVHAAWGKICILNRDPVTARKAFERTLQLQPDNVDGWTGLMALDAASNGLRDFGRRLEARIAVSPRKADLLLIHAKVALLSRDAGKAEQALKQAIGNDPAQLESFTMLGRLYVLQGKLPSATNEFLKVAQLEPNSVPASTMLGLLYHAQKNIPEATKWYERAAQVDPAGAAAANNNLAWLMVEGGGNLDTALRLAQLAKSRAPDQPQFNDTLGWIYYKRDMIAQAINVLEFAAQAMPNNPTYQYHLGLAHAKAGDDSKARRALERALKLAPNFPAADDARKTLATLVY